MDQKRFGAGLAIGILLALAVMAGSIALGPGTTGVVFDLVPASSGSVSVTTSTYHGLTTTTDYKSSNTTQAGANYPGSLTTTTTSTQTSASATEGSSSSAAPPPQNFLDLGSVVNQPNASQVGSLPRQPLALSVLVLLPVLVALVLGTLLYMATRRRQGEEKD